METMVQITDKWFPVINLICVTGCVYNTYIPPVAHAYPPAT